MRQLDYNNSSHTLRLEFPSLWDAVSITGVDITIKNTGATDLVTQTAATLYTATTLASGATSGSNSVTLDAGAGDLAQGDRIRLVGPAEDVTVRSYNTSTKVATLEETLVYDHDSGSSVSPLWATYALDTSDTDTWVKNLECTIFWEPDIDGASRIELAQVKDRRYDVSDFSNKFRLLYPSEHDIVGDRIGEFIELATQECRNRLEIKGMDPDKVVNSDLLDPIFLKYARWIVVSAGGNEWQYERGAAWDDYVQLETELVSSPLWVDEDLGLDEEGEEVDTHQPVRIMRPF